MKLYSIYDAPSHVFNPIFALSDDVAARRYAEALCRQKESIYHDYKDDFSLYCVGEYNFDSDVNIPLIKPYKPTLILAFSSISI